MAPTVISERQLHPGRLFFGSSMSRLIRSLSELGQEKTESHSQNQNPKGDINSRVDQQPITAAGDGQEERKPSPSTEEGCHEKNDRGPLLAKE